MNKHANASVECWLCMRCTGARSRSSGSATMVLSGQAGTPRAMREANRRRRDVARQYRSTRSHRSRSAAALGQQVASQRTTRGMRFGMVSDERMVDHGSLARSLFGPARWRGRSGSKGAKGEVGLAKGLLFTRPTLALSAATISKMPVKPPASISMEISLHLEWDHLRRQREVR
jgi:hypothetical protein